VRAQSGADDPPRRRPRRRELPEIRNLNQVPHRGIRPPGTDKTGNANHGIWMTGPVLFASRQARSILAGKTKAPTMTHVPHWRVVTYG
jgi:hypothetical protein